MSPLLAETLIPITALAKRCPAGRGTNPSHTAHRTTVLRWIIAGVKVRVHGKPAVKVKLEAVRQGGRWMTSEQAYARFVDACGDAAGLEPAVLVSRTPAQTRRAGEQAMRDLEKMFKQK